MKIKDDTKKIIRISIIVLIIIVSIIAIISTCLYGTSIITRSAQYAESNALTTEDGRFEYIELGDGTIEISKYIGTETEVIIPSSIDGKVITTIGYMAFRNCSNITDIEILEGVKRLKNDVFYNCSNLTNIKIPSSVTNIGGSAFMGCTSLRNISVELSNEHYLTEDGVMFNKDKTTLVAYPAGKTENEYKISDEVVNISDYAFYGSSSLNRIEIPVGTTNIGYGAFWGCVSLNNVKIPKGTISIKNYTFNDCKSLTDIDIPEGIIEIGNSGFKGCTSLSSIKIPEGVNDIGSEAFRGCSSLITIILPNSVTNMGSYTFYGCSSLTSIEIPEGVTSIGSYAFDGCSSLTSIEIPEGVTSIGSYAFYGCSSLTSIEIPEEVTSIGDNTFRGCSSLTSIEIPEGVTSIGNSAFYGCSSLTSIEIPEEVTSIENYAFDGCSSLTSIEIPEGVTSIGNSAFCGCSSVTSIKIPGSVKNMGDQVFFGCRSLISIEISKGLTSIGYEAFRGCESLTSIKIPDSVINVGNAAFYGCHSLTSIEISEGLTSIGNEAFFACTSLTSIKIPNSVTNIGTRVFVLCTNLISIEISNSLTSISDEAFFDCTSLKNIEIPNSVMSIGESAFYSCESLTSIKIPDSVTSIGDKAFAHCEGLTCIKIPDSVTSIGNEAFYSCESLASIIIPDSVTNIESNVFSYSSNLTIYCKSNSTAQTYAESNEIPYVIDDKAPTIEDVIVETTEWTNEPVILTICGTNDEGVGLDEQPYSWDGGATWSEYSQAGIIENTDVLIQVRDKLGNIYIHQPISITNIDYYAPTIESVTGNPTEWTNESVTLTINGAEDGLSGLHNEPYSFDGGITWQVNNTKIYEQNTERIVIKVRDAVGNEYTHEEISITKIDKTAPMIENVEGNPTEWTNENVRLTINRAEDSLSGLHNEPYSFDGGITWQAENTKIYEQNTEGIVIKVRDILENIYTHDEISITKIDKTAPMIENVEGNPTEWTNENVTLTINGAEDSLSGLHKEPYSFDGGKTWQEENSKTYDQNTNGIVIKVRDALENVYAHEVINITKIMKAVKINVTTNPTKMKYKAHEDFNPKGMKIEVTYDNGQTEETTEYTIINGEKLTCKTSTVEIQYNKNTEIKTVLEGITVEHIEISINEKPANCTETGLTEGKYCSACGETLKVQEEIPALGHSFTNYVSDNNATCTQDGTKTAKCDRCDETHTIADEGSKLSHNYENGKCTGCGQEEPKITITSEKYTISGEYITKIADKTTLNAFKESISTNAEEIKILNKDNQELEAEETIGTGMILILKSATETKKYKLVVSGDVTGDGKADFKDIVLINRYRLHKTTLANEYLMAGEVTGDNKVDFKDIVKINRFRLHKILGL